jgi:hypothetical protein
MQEVEVAPRDVFIHYINARKGKTILWWFSTKKKNISFGLYQRKGPAVSAKKAFIAAAKKNLTTEVRTPQEGGHLSPSLSATKSRTSLQSVASGVSRTSIDTDTNDTNDTDDNEEENNAELGAKDSASTHSLQPTSPAFNRGRKKSVSAQIIKDPDLKEILPIEHYNSAYTTIKGSYQVQEDGTYCLCFGKIFSFMYVINLYILIFF